LRGGWQLTAVQWRKIMFGNRSIAGEFAVARLLTVTRTCQLQQLNMLEKSYSRRALKQLLDKAGLDVVAETAILFIPGWLRMLDLACHAWCRPLAVVTAALVWPFILADRHIPAVRRPGYLLATVVVKPERGG
jgi:hypothetical protein